MNYKQMTSAAVLLTSLTTAGITNAEEPIPSANISPNPAGSCYDAWKTDHLGNVIVRGIVNIDYELLNQPTRTRLEATAMEILTVHEGKSTSVEIIAQPFDTHLKFKAGDTADNRRIRYRTTTAELNHRFVDVEKPMEVIITFGVYDDIEPLVEGVQVRITNQCL